MTLQDVEAFVAVVDSGSVVGASAKLHLSQPAVTRRLQALEQSLGETLLDRTSKPQLPTAAGKRAYALARRILSSVEDLRHSFGEGVDTGEFRFGSTPRITEAGLIEAVTALRAAHPRLTLRATSAWSAALIEQVQDGRLDAAALSAPDHLENVSGLEVTPIGHQVGCVIVPKDDPLPAKATLAQVAQRPWVLNNDGCSMRGLLAAAFRDRGLPFGIAVEASGPELQLGLVARGAGIGLITAHSLARSPLRAAVRAIEVKEFRPKLTSHLIHKPLPDRFVAPVALLRKSLEQSLRAGAV